MLQPDAFCEHTLQQNATAEGAPPRTPLGELIALPDPLAGFKGAASRRREEKGGKGKGKEERGREGGEGRGGEVDSNAQLEQGRRLAKAGPDRTRPKQKINEKTLKIKPILQDLKAGEVSESGRYQKPSVPGKICGTSKF